jgi:epoxide hydrolase-like predicted phosphatase
MAAERKRTKEAGQEAMTGRAQLYAAIFDLGGVMTEPIFRGLEVAPAYAGLLGFFLTDCRDVYHLPTGVHDLHQLETGQILEPEFFRRLCLRYAEAGNQPVDPDEALHAVWGHQMIACAAMVDAVRQVRDAGFRTALLTNISRGAEAMWRSVIPVDELFDVITDSSLVGLRKPDPRIFELTCERLGVAPDRCLFVDDIQCNVDAAAALGMETIRCVEPMDAADEVVLRLLGRRAGSEAEPAPVP